MEFMQRFFKDLRGAADLYCQSFQLCFSKNSQYSSSLGQISSLLIHTICLFTFISLTLELLALSNPNIVSKITSNLNPERVTLNPENFFIGFGVVDQDGFPIVNYQNYTIFGVRMAFVLQTTIVGENGRPISVSNFTDIQMVPCPQTVVGEDVKNQFQEKLSVMYCPNVTDWYQKTNLTYLQGLVISQVVSYLFVRVYPCRGQYAIDNNITTCAPESTVLSNMVGGYVVSAVYDNLLDQSEPGNPYNKTLRVQTSQYKYGVKTTHQYLLRHSYFYSETNFFHYFPSVDKYHVLTQSGQSASTNSDSYTIFESNFIIDDHQEQYFRSYSTFFDVLGNIGGIQSFLVLIVGLFINPIIQQSQQIDMINEVFDVDIDNNHDRQVEKGQLNVNFYEILFSLCCGNKRQYIVKGSEEIKKYLDIVTIIRKLNQIERLKYLLLDDHQLKMFDFVSDPKLTVGLETNKVQQDPKIYIEEPEQSIKIEDYGQAFQRMTKSSSQLDQKMLTLVKPSMVRTFERLAGTDRELHHVSKYAKSNIVVPFRSIDSIVEDS